MGFFYDDRPSKSTAQHAGTSPRCSCEACGNPTTLLHDFIDRHGDIWQLCERCYKLAVNPAESPELARRDRKVAAWLAVIGVVALSFVLFGCANGEIRYTVYDGIPVIEHIDTFDAPEPCTRRYTDGCWQMVSFYGNITHHIWRSDIGPAYVLKHEVGHAKGMRHSAFAVHPIYRTNCATITVGIEGYPAGSLVCNDGRSEWIVDREAV